MPLFSTVCSEGATIKVINNLVSRLKVDIESWRVGDGIALLQTHSASLKSLSPDEKQAPFLIGYLAQWVDLGFEDIGTVKRVLARFSPTLRRELPLTHYVHLCMADALVAMEQREYDRAILHLETVLSLRHEIRNRELEVMSSFWLGKCHMRMGYLDNAISHVVKARDLAAEMGWHGMSAAIQVLHSDLISQAGKSNESLRLLRTTEVIAFQSDDYLTRGNVHSTRARIARRKGKFEEALQFYQKAICEYKKRNLKHPHLTRALLEMGYIKRAIALKLQGQADREVAHRHVVRPGSANHAGRKQRLRIEVLRKESRTHLAEAAVRYKSESDTRGIGIVLINCSRLDLDSGQLDLAATQAAEAFQLANETNDYVLKVRARAIESMVENAKFDEQIDDGSDPGHHALLAYQLASEAVDFAREMPSPGLLAGALIAKGMILANDYFSDRDGARLCADEATRLLRTRGESYVCSDLELVKARINQMAGIDDVVREFSHCNLENRTFQEITEEFAAIVIPKIWKNEGRKISRVVERLSISPKKVRRILCSVGLLNMDGSRSNKMVAMTKPSVKVAFRPIPRRINATAISRNTRLTINKAVGAMR